MLFLPMPRTFKIGDTADCRINGQPRRVTWRDAKTLVLDGTEERAIITTNIDNEAVEFTATDAGESAEDYFVEAEWIKQVT